MHVHAHAGTRVHEATSLTGLVPERVQLTVHSTEPTGTVPEPFHCDHIARWSARSGTSGRSGTGLNTGNWNGSGTVLVSNLWCEHGLTFDWPLAASGRWPPDTGTVTRQSSWYIPKVAGQSRWPFTQGTGRGRYYCIVFCPNNVDSLPELMSTNCPN